MRPTIFMIHGSGAGAWTWENFKNYFEHGGHDCIAPDLPYHGLNCRALPKVPQALVSLSDHFEFLKGKLQKLGELEAPLILMGHSMGGLLAQMLAGAGFGDAAVLLAPAPPLGINLAHHSSEQIMASAILNKDQFEKAEKAPFEFYQKYSFNRIPAEKQRELYDRLDYESGRIFFEVGYSSLDLTYASYVDETKVTCPVLLLVGKEDKRVPPPVVHKIAEKYAPHSTLQEFEGHAHWLLLEPGWKNIAESIGKWLGTIFPD